jgi:hypothetical protein
MHRTIFGNALRAHVNHACARTLNTHLKKPSRSNESLMAKFSRNKHVFTYTLPKKGNSSSAFGCRRLAALLVSSFW